jgi:hypothetical protein
MLKGNKIIKKSRGRPFGGANLQRAENLNSLTDN